MSDATPMSHLNADLAYVSHGNRRYSAVFVPECHTCRSAHRVQIERLLVEGLPPKTIIQRLPDDCGVSPQSVRRHFRRGHLPVDAEAVRDRQRIRGEQRWEELGLAATAFVASQADICQHVVDVCTQLILEGKLKISAATLLRAAEFLLRIENDAREREDDSQLAKRLVQQAVDELGRVFEIIAEVGGEEIQNEVVRRACADMVTQNILVDDRFADLRNVAYFDAEISVEINQPSISQLSTPRLRHQQPSTRTSQVAA